MSAKQSSPETVDEYLADVPEDAREVLQNIRETIAETAPDAEGGISYGIPLYKIRGKHLIGFAAGKGHLSLYVTDSKLIEEYARELAPFDHAGTKTTIRFTVDEPLPSDLVRKIVAGRMERLSRST